MNDEAKTAQAKDAPAEPHNFRLATDPHGGHGYEVGFWPSGADLNDPTQYVVVERCYTQADAARLAAHHDANPPDHLPPDEAGPGGGREGNEDEHKPRRTTSHRR